MTNSFDIVKFLQKVILIEKMVNGLRTSSKT